MAGNRVKNALNLAETRNRGLQVLQLVGEVVLLLLKMAWASLEALFRIIVPVPQKPVKGEIVLITGAGHGIGRELALQYASKGATVICWDINPITNQETVDQIANLGYPKAHGYVCDIANRIHVMQTAKKLQAEVGDVSILINNAGIMRCQEFLDYKPEEIEQIIAVNANAHFWTIQAFLPTMLKNNHGHIVAVSSGAGLIGLRNILPYCASKFAVRGMMEALFHELRVDSECQIKLTTIYPYGVDTGLCKRPKLRFPNAMPLLDPAYVAEYIMKAQRCNVLETIVPGFLLTFHNLCRLLPQKAINYLLDFFDSYPEPDP